LYTRRRRRDEPTWLCIAKRFRSLGTGPNGSLRTQEYPYGFQNEFQQYENGQSPGNQRNCVPCMDTFGYLPIGQRRFCNQRPLQYRYDKAKKSVAARISEMPREKVELLIQSFSERAKKERLALDSSIAAIHRLNAILILSPAAALGSTEFGS